MYRETLEAEREQLVETELTEDTNGEVATRRLLRAVETYKASCLVNGEEPTVEDSWLVLLSALHLEENK